MEKKLGGGPTAADQINLVSRKCSKQTSGKKIDNPLSLSFSSALALIRLFCFWQRQQGSILVLTETHAE
jgi:hypothetical protein